MIRPRSKPRPGRLKGVALQALRAECFDEAKGRCMNCGIALNLKQPPEHPQSYHMAHIRNKRMWGDSIENVRALCGSCHRDSHNAGGKPCPPKGDAYVDKGSYRSAEAQHDKVPAEEQE